MGYKEVSVVSGFSRADGFSRRSIGSGSIFRQDAVVVEVHFARAVRIGRRSVPCFAPALGQELEIQKVNAPVQFQIARARVEQPDFVQE